MTRREQWIQFYTAALVGCSAIPELPEDAAARAAAKTADEAMAQLDARDFPEPKVRALLLTAQTVWKAASHKNGFATIPSHLMATLGAAIHDMEAAE